MAICIHSHPLSLQLDSTSTHCLLNLGLFPERSSCPALPISLSVRLPHVHCSESLLDGGVLDAGNHGGSANAPSGSANGHVSGSGSMGVGVPAVPGSRSSTVGVGVGVGVGVSGKDPASVSASGAAPLLLAPEDAEIRAEKGLLSLVTADRPGLYVRDPQSQWLLADANLARNEVLLLTGLTLYQVGENGGEGG